MIDIATLKELCDVENLCVKLFVRNLLFTWVCMLNVRKTKPTIKKQHFGIGFCELICISTGGHLTHSVNEIAVIYRGFRCHSHALHERKWSHRITVIALCINQASEFRRNANRSSFNWNGRIFLVAPWLYVHVIWFSGDATMDFHSGEPRAHIRAPSLKRGKNDNGLNERVSLKLFSI